MPRPNSVEDGDGGWHRLPSYDAVDFREQLSPFPDWAMPQLIGRAATSDERERFADAWMPLLAEVTSGDRGWALRDYHSPNLMWLADRQGAARVGLLDFQDALLLHPVYDVASVAQDARVTVPAELETALLERYLAGRQAADAGLDVAAYRRAYAILAAQRATRILGIFARLARRDGRPEYLQHMPRVQSYLRRSLVHPALAAVADWFAATVPAALGDDR